MAVLTFKSIAWMVGLWMVYKVGVALYNISPFHPLAAFPGPKIAAASYLYEGYWDFWRVGRYTKVIEQMHKKYGESLWKAIVSKTRGFFFVLPAGEFLHLTFLFLPTYPPPPKKNRPHRTHQP